MGYDDFKKEWDNKSEKEILIAILWKLNNWEEDKAKDIIEALKSNPVTAAKHFSERDKGKKSNPNDPPAGFRVGNQ